MKQFNQKQLDFGLFLWPDAFGFRQEFQFLIFGPLVGLLQHQYWPLPPEVHCL